MNTQQAFDIMVAHLRQQGRPSRYDAAGCAYRGPDGLKCAVGALIPDELYRDNMEGRTIRTLLISDRDAYHKLSRLLDRVDVQLLEEMQTIHDHNEPKQWEKAFKYVAEEFNLNYTAPQGV